MVGEAEEAPAVAIEAVVPAIEAVAEAVVEEAVVEELSTRPDRAGEVLKGAGVGFVVEIAVGFAEVIEVHSGVAIVVVEEAVEVAGRPHKFMCKSLSSSSLEPCFLDVYST